MQLWSDELMGEGLGGLTHSVQVPLPGMSWARQVCMSTMHGPEGEERVVPLAVLTRAVPALWIHVPHWPEGL